MTQPPESCTITHGRHCACSSCAAQDWAEPVLAPCGMHGPSCPPIYQPLGGAGDSTLPAGVHLLKEPHVVLGDCQGCGRESGEDYHLIVPLGDWRGEIGAIGWYVHDGKILCWDCVPEDDE